MKIKCSRKFLLSKSGVAQNLISLALEGEGARRAGEGKNTYNTKSGTIGLNPLIPVLTHSAFPLMGKGTTRGFTLIELLVVVLIIAILAAVALPQYQKAVKKARFAQVDVIIDAAKKNIETYLLENGFPTSGRVILAGRNNVGPISMPGNCDLAVATCFTEVGGVTVSCQENKECSIELDTRDFADGSSGNNWLDKNVIFLFRDSVGVWYVEDVNEATQEVCKWIQDRGYLGHPRGVVGPCSELGIKIEAYQF